MGAGLVLLADEHRISLPSMDMYRKRESREGRVLQEGRHFDVTTVQVDLLATFEARLGFSFIVRPLGEHAVEMSGDMVTTAHVPKLCSFSQFRKSYVDILKCSVNSE